MNYTTYDLKGWFNLSLMLNTHRLHLSRYDTSPLLRFQPLLIMLLVFHGTLVWKYSSLLPRNVSFCWEQFHIHSICTANQKQLVLGAESPPVWHHREKRGKKRKKGFLGGFCIWCQTSSVLLVSLARIELLTKKSPKFLQGTEDQIQAYLCSSAVSNESVV